MTATAPPIFVMAEHPQDAASLKASLAEPGCAGLVVHVRAADIATGNLAIAGALFELAASAGKLVHLATSPLPLLSGQPSITLDGEARPLFWEGDCISDDADVMNLLAAFVAKAGWTKTLHGLRCCFTTAADGDAELGVYAVPATSIDATYWVNWADAGLTPAAYISAMLAATAARTKAFPGLRISLSVLDPMDFRIGGSGSILGRRDHGVMARALNQACSTAIGGSAVFAAGNTNFRTTLPAATMIYTQAMAQLGELFLQLDDAGTTDADFLGLLNATLPYAPAWREAHQRQMTPGVWASLAGAAAPAGAAS